MCAWRGATSRSLRSSLKHRGVMRLGRDGGAEIEMVFLTEECAPANSAAMSAREVIPTAPGSYS